MTTQLLQRRIWHPRLLWRRETDLVRWMATHLDQLSGCLGVDRLECIGREMVIGERSDRYTPYGRRHLFSEMRLDLAATDGQGRLVVVEAQFGPPDYDHMGKLLTYAQTVDAYLAVWLVADMHPEFDIGLLNTLAEQEALFAGRRHFAVVAVTVASDLYPGPIADDEPVRPWLHRISLHGDS
jgi:hypothetical protein